jgi:hypothetical protein
MGWLCDQVVKGGGVAIADFICPTVATREAFVEGGPAVTVWVDRIQLGRFADTNKLFKGPLSWDVRVEPEGTPEYWAEQVAKLVRPSFDPNCRPLFSSAATSRCTRHIRRLSRKASSASGKRALQCAIPAALT